MRRMPWTALCFLVGAVAISGLPPLNGFVSEWLTFQSLLLGFGDATETLPRLLLPGVGRAAGADQRAGRGLLCQGLRHRVSWRCRAAGRGRGARIAGRDAGAAAVPGRHCVSVSASFRGACSA